MFWSTPVSSPCELSLRQGAMSVKMLLPGPLDGMNRDPYVHTHVEGASVHAEAVVKENRPSTHQPGSSPSSNTLQASLNSSACKRETNVCFCMQLLLRYPEIAHTRSILSRAVAVPPAKASLHRACLLCYMVFACCSSPPPVSLLAFPGSTSCLA